MANENLYDNLCTLDGRLLCAASFVRDGSVVCDIGTDHAYIPVYLIQQGIAKFAVASDINIGPLNRAKQSAAKYGVTDKIRFVLADGLDGVHPEEDGVNDIIICGMGGELIARIVDSSDYTRTAGVNLILQPMTCAPELRKYLGEAGFCIMTERLCEAAGKIYTCIHAAYDGVTREYTPAEQILGRYHIEKRSPLFNQYADTAVRRLKKQILGMKKGGLDTAAEEGILMAVESAIAKMGE